jgi:hypothetical protein
MAELLLLGYAVALLAAVWILRRPVAADRALLRQNRDLHDQLMAHFGDERDWLSHRRQMAEIEASQKVATTAREVRTFAELRQAPMEVDEPTEVGMPDHGAGPLG